LHKNKRKTQLKLQLLSFLLPLVFLAIINNTSLNGSQDNTTLSVNETFNDVLSFSSVNNLTSLHINCKEKSLRLNVILLLMISGDINPNPGPVSCPYCHRTIAKNHRFVCCTRCNSSYHIKCANISPKEYKIMQADNSFFCTVCFNDTMPFSNGENSYLENADSDASFNENTQSLNEVLGRKGLKFAHLNINGISSKLDQIRIILFESNLDILCLNETKIDDNTKDTDINIPGYTLFRKDRNKYGGGVLLYVASRLNSSSVKLAASVNQEILWVKISLPSTRPIYICSVYRPPSHGSDIQQTKHLCTVLESQVRSFARNSEVYILGDLNCDLLKKNNLSSQIKEFSKLSHLTQKWCV